VTTGAYAGQTLAAYEDLKSWDHEARVNMLKTIDADVKDMDMDKETQLSVATRLKQACAQLGNIVCAILFSIPKLTSVR
jgi:hypothetical protein